MRRAFVIMSLPNSCWETELHYAQWSHIDDKTQNMCGSSLGSSQTERSDSPGNTYGGSEAKYNMSRGKYFISTGSEQQVLN